MSAYPTYDRKIMEVIRQLTIEEMMMALADLASALQEDRLRDIGPSRSLGIDDLGIRPAVHGWKAIDHAMRTAGFDMPGYRQKSDLTDLLGEEGGEEIWEQQMKLEEVMEEVGSIMEEWDVDVPTATICYRLQITPEELELRMTQLREDAKDRHPSTSQTVTIEDLLPGVDDVPDDLGGFGWGTGDE